MTDDQPDDATEQTVTVPVETAETARDELRRLIDRTGGDDPDDGEAMTPLARVRECIKRELPRSVRCPGCGFHPHGSNAGAAKPGDPCPHCGETFEPGERAAVLDIIEEVGEETGEETAPVDPLTDGTFRAFDHLDAALGGPERASFSIYPDDGEACGWFAVLDPDAEVPDLPTGALDAAQAATADVAHRLDADRGPIESVGVVEYLPGKHTGAVLDAEVYLCAECDGPRPPGPEVCPACEDQQAAADYDTHPPGPSPPPHGNTTR